MTQDERVLFSIQHAPELILSRNDTTVSSNNNKPRTTTPRSTKCRLQWNQMLS